MPEQSLELHLIVTVKPEPDLTAEEKAAFYQQYLIDTAAAMGDCYSYGLTVNGNIVLPDNTFATFEHNKPDYVEVV